MNNPTPVVIDISSDDEFQPPEDPMPTAETLEKVDGEKDANEADDNKLSELKPAKDIDEEKGDDDCLILDGDPYRTGEPAKNVAVDGDDVLVVGETGQVACRDYPHSRHLCVKFPFSTALHSEHCNLCHCYVCDLPAPCGNWGTGLHSNDHCHATDASKEWKTKRTSFRGLKKCGSVAPNSLPKTSAPRTNMAASCHGQVGRATAVRAWSSQPTHLASNSVPTVSTLSTGRSQVPTARLGGISVQMASSAAGHGQASKPTVVTRPSLAAGHSQVSMPAAVRACSSSVPSTIVQSGTARAMDIQWRNGSMPREPVLGTFHYTNLGPTIIPPLTNQMFHGSGANLSTNQAAFGTNQVQKYVYYPHAADYAMNRRQRTALSKEATMGSTTPLQQNLFVNAPPYRIVPSVVARQSQSGEHRSTALSNKVEAELRSQHNLVANSPRGFQSGEQRTTLSNKVTVGSTTTLAREFPLQQNVIANAPPYPFGSPLSPHVRQSKVPRIGDQTTNAAASAATTSFSLRI